MNLRKIDVMNLHHLELFYYVARHGGIMQAVRSIPYGIQQPAVSGQIAQLEQELGHTLFQRRPFKLYPAGEQLYAFIKPFFEALPEVESRIRGQQICPLRIAAPTVVVKSHLPILLAQLRQQHPHLRLRLNEAPQDSVEKLLNQGEIDLGITLLESPPETASGLETVKLLSLRPVLLTPPGIRTPGPRQNLRSFIEHHRASTGLIALGSEDRLTRHVRAWLLGQGLAWLPTIEVTSLHLVETYVRHGFGLGLSVLVPGEAPPPGLGIVPLKHPDLGAVDIGILYRKPLSPVAESFVQAAQQHARALGKQ